jgi:hypothetical protein
MIMVLDFETVLNMWYFLFSIFGGQDLENVESLKINPQTIRN